MYYLLLGIKCRCIKNCKFEMMMKVKMSVWDNDKTLMNQYIPILVKYSGKACLKYFVIL